MTPADLELAQQHFIELYLRDYQPPVPVPAPPPVPHRWSRGPRDRWLESVPLGIWRGTSWDELQDVLRAA